MLSLLNKKTINTSKTVSKKFKYFRQQTDLDYVGDYFYTNETPSNIFINNTKKEDSSINCRISTFPTERNEVPKKKAKTITHREYSKKRNKNKNHNVIKIFASDALFSKKIIHRPKTTSKKKLKKNEFFKTDLNIDNIFKNNNKNIQKRLLNGVPLSFIESMRLNTETNLAKADLFFKEEKKRMLRENPILKYQLEYSRRQKIKKEELEKVNNFKIWKKYLKRNKKEYDFNKINAYHIKLLLHENKQYFENIKPLIDKSKFNENKQYFENIKPLIDKSKFSPKYRLLSNNDKEEQKKIFNFTNVRKIFSHYLGNNKIIKKEKTKVKYSKEITNVLTDKNIIYQRFKIIIKQCAVEFKNIKIPIYKIFIYF